jgi:hypothetical protein
MALKSNRTGKCPREAHGKRVRVSLVNGYDSKVKEPSGWPADGKGACRWSRTAPPHNGFDIDQYEVI